MMNRIWILFLGLLAVVLLPQPCEANEAVQTAAKTAVENVTGKTLGKLYKARSQASTPVRNKMDVRACIAGLYAIGDVKNAQKISEGVGEDAFISSLMDVCEGCNGEGVSSQPCYTCKGTGSCQNRKCNDGVVTSVGFDGRSSERKCATCGGTGCCSNCKGTGTTERKCNRCQGSGSVINKKLASSACQELLKALSTPGKEIEVCSAQVAKKTVAKVVASKSAVNGNRPSPSSPGFRRSAARKSVASGNGSRSRDGAEERDRKQKEQLAKLEAAESARKVQQGILANRSGAHETFQKYKFDFEEYRQWENEETTEMQKRRIIQRLFQNGFKSVCCKDWVRCYFALVPDGLSFVVVNVTEGALNGHGGYFVLIKLEDGASGGNNVLANILYKQCLFHYYGVCLFIPAYDKDVETWKKGMIIVSKGWVYDVGIINTVRIYENGAKWPDQRISTFQGGLLEVFRSMDERIAIETGAEEGRASQMLNSGSKGPSSPSVDSRLSSSAPVQNPSSGTRSEDLFPMWKCRYCGNVVPGSTPPSISTCVQHRENGGFGPCVFDKVR